MGLEPRGREGGRRRGVSVTPLKRGKYKSRNTKILCMERRSSSMLGGGIWTNRPANIEPLRFHQMRRKRVESWSEIMDDLIWRIGRIDWGGRILAVRQAAESAGG